VDIPLNMSIEEAHIVQLLPVTNNMTAVFDTPSFGAKAAPWQERMPLVCWALVEHAGVQAIEGIVIDSTGRLTFAKSCKHFLGFGYPGDDNRWAHKIHWDKIGNEYRQQLPQQESESVPT
jgi:hypothetical protein